MQRLFKSNQDQPRALALCGRVCALLLPFTLAFLACTEGDFDQRFRADIEELRDNAFILINSNPQGKDQITGYATNAGQISSARVTLHPINPDGTPDFSPQSILGDSLTRGSSSPSFEPPPGYEAGSLTSLAIFVSNIRRSYRGPVLIALSPTTAAGTPSSIANPARGYSAPQQSMQAGDELLGYCLDRPYASDARMVSIFTHLVVERARFLGGISSGNLTLASFQVGQFFGLDHVRAVYPKSLLQEIEPDDRGESLAIDLAHAALSQLAHESGARQMDLYRALTLDMRDDGELNGSIGLIPGTGVALPDLGQAGYIGTQLLRNGYLAEANEENLSGFDVSYATAGSALDAQLIALNAPRMIAGTSLELTEASIERQNIGMIPGQSTDLGVRGFAQIAGERYTVVSSDGPSVANLSAVSDDASVAEVTIDGRVRIPTGATPGTSTLIRISLAPDGVHLTGGFTAEFLMRVTVVAP